MLAAGRAAASSTSRWSSSGGTVRLRGARALAAPGVRPRAAGEFIPVAEETGLIVPIGEWVLRDGLPRRAAWQAQGPPPAPHERERLPAQLRDAEFPATSRACCARTASPRSALQLEITESVLIDKADAPIARLAPICGRRGSVSRSTTSARATRRSPTCSGFPVDVLKIDRSFIAGLAATTEDSAIVAPIVQPGAHARPRRRRRGRRAPRAARARCASSGCDRVAGPADRQPMPAVRGRSGLTASAMA